MGPAIPAGDNDDVVVQLGPFQHSQDDETCAAFAVIVFQRAAFQQDAVGVVGRLGEFLGPAEGLDEITGGGGRRDGPAGHRVF